MALTPAEMRFYDKLIKMICPNADHSKTNLFLIKGGKSKKEKKK